MNLYRAIGSIGGLTMVSRLLGFARDMIGSRVLGASHANDAFNLAFLLPNIFRRLFAEGAFSSGFVPLFSRLGDYFENPASWSAALVEHAAVLEAIRARDAQAARDAMQQHLKKATSRYSASWRRANHS